MASALLRRIMRPVNSIHVALYRMSRGRTAGHAAGLPLLLLTTTGRKSGKPHTNPVAYLNEGPDYLVSASTGGMTWHPGWYFNLRGQAGGENTGWQPNVQSQSNHYRRRGTQPVV